MGVTYWLHKLGCLTFQIWEILNFTSLNTLSAPFSFFSPFKISKIMRRLFLLMPSHKSHGFSSLLLILFCFYNCIIPNNLSLSSLILSSAWCSLLLKISIEVFSLVIVFFSSKFFLWLFVVYYL